VRADGLLTLGEGEEGDEGGYSACEWRLGRRLMMEHQQAGGGTNIEAVFEGLLHLFRQIFKCLLLFFRVGIVWLQHRLVFLPKVLDGAVNGVGGENPDDF